MKPRDFVVRVVSATPKEAQESRVRVFAHSGAHACLSYALRRRAGQVLGMGPLPDYTTLEAVADDGQVKPVYYLWASGSVSRTHATRPVDRPAARAVAAS